MSKRKLALSFYGGKFSKLSWLLPLLPTREHGIIHYAEVYGGSAAVLLNRNPCSVETYNDLYGEVVNFFRVLRDCPEELIYKLSLTPFSFEEYVKSIDYSDVDENDHVELARRFYVKCRQSRNAMVHTAIPSSWQWCRMAVVRDMSSAVSKWFGGIEKLPEIVDRLARVQIDNHDAISVIKKADSLNTLFYVDPPYLHDSRTDNHTYGDYEMSLDQHEQLRDTLHNVKGYVALSGYHHPLIDEWYKDWFVYEDVEKMNHATHRTKRQEVLWTNYNATTMKREAK